ncbi:MAG: hypothetical protein A2054_09845 [Deltaproteobacteria bacterium GWA2_55_10]|nr:MAG: hypothetical protein A2054_09845 [Deltaproteobacteria bacterium GWA2_55_10]
MVIADSNISMNALRSHVEHGAKKSELKAWLGPRPSENDRDAMRRPVADTLEISEEARSRFESMKKRFVEGGCERRAIEMPEGIDNETFVKKLLLEALTGKKIKVMSIEPVKPGDVEALKNAGETAQAEAAPEWGMTYESSETVASVEAVTFSASGTIRTKDGAEISFDLSLSMMRASITETNTSVKAGNAIDPLVINYSGSAAELTSMKFEFDLDSDGTNELIPFAGHGSGFLAIDLNGDGKVNNGNELFGPRTGNGFSELAHLDHDNNKWIDEADQAYNNLFVWSKDLDGKDVLKTLKEFNIGAISLSYTNTSFEVRDSFNTTTGQVQSTGLFLTEDMTPGTVQQIDLVV